MSWIGWDFRIQSRPAASHHGQHALPDSSGRASQEPRLTGVGPVPQAACRDVSAIALYVTFVDPGRLQGMPRRTPAGASRPPWMFQTHDRRRPDARPARLLQGHPRSTKQHRKALQDRYHPHHRRVGTGPEPGGPQMLRMPTPKRRLPGAHHQHHPRGPDQDRFRRPRPRPSTTRPSRSTTRPCATPWNSDEK